MVTFRCPTCRQLLARAGPAYRCDAGHSFDVAAEGYVNLLVKKASRQPGDSPEMVRARRRFLRAGAYQPVADAVKEALASSRGLLLDAGCGEGWYTAQLRAPEREVVGVDVAKTAVRFAAKADPEGTYAVASVFDIPLGDGAASAIVTIFGPVDADEFARVLAPDGTLVAVHPGPDHLRGLRALVYDNPTQHEVKDPLRHAPDLFMPLGRHEARGSFHLGSNEEVMALLAMTPYYWKLDDAARARFAAVDELDLDLDVLLTTYARL